MNLIKEFLLYRKALHSFQELELTDLEKVELSLFKKTTMKKIVDTSLSQLTKEMIREDLSIEYVRGYRQGCLALLSHFRKINN